MKSKIYEAKFITADPKWKGRAPLFKREFKARGGLIRATLDITALGVYEATINGKRVGDFIMAPGWTSYNKRLPYQTYDITDLIKKGNNGIVVGVGSGWYGSYVGFGGIYPLGDHPALVMAITLEYADGCEYILSDESFKVAKSETIESTIYNGEVTDARVKPRFASSARLFKGKKPPLYAFDGVPVREIERVSAKEIIITPRGELVIDFGQNLTGYPEFTVNCRGGEKLLITCAEILDKDGNFYNENYRSAKSLINYTAREGVQTYKPHYTFFGFRYLQLVGFPEGIKKEDFTAIVVHSDIERAGYFKSGHAKLNKLYENVIWGQRGNFLDVPTDCPQRDERLGWTGDAQVFCRTAMLNYNCDKFFRKWLRDLALDQCEDGGVPRVIPDTSPATPEMTVENLGRRHSAAWGDAATICPWEHYMAYGDEKFLKECFPSMKKWVEFIEKYSDNYAWTVGFHYGDWLALDNAEDIKGLTEHPLIATAFFYHSAELVVKAGRILKKDVTHFEEILPKIKAAFHERFIKDGRLTSDTQTAHVLAIHFGLCEGELREKLARRLVELIEERGDALTTGFVGTPYLLDTLTEIGRPDKAYSLLLREKFPSWLFSVNMGATTIWEHWDGINDKGEIWQKSMNSFNHYAYGSVAAWFYRTICGIRYDESAPAYKHFFLTPTPCKELGCAKAKINTPSGEIISEWCYEADGGIRYSFTIPNGATATLTLGGESVELKAGKYTKFCK